jgi:hypothetical protein
MGLILVFDLDQTIINTDARGVFPGVYPMTEEYKNLLKEQLNPRVLDILLRAAKLRRIGVDAIFLLTNNSNPNYVANIDALLLELSNNSIGQYKKRKVPFVTEDIPGTDFFFDYIMTANHPYRRDMIKSTHEIEYMMGYLGMSMSVGDLFSRLYFFDDVANHEIRRELKYYSDGKYSNHYIFITPPFRPGYDDRSNYEPIESALTELETSKIDVVVQGGNRYKSKHKKTQRKTMSKLKFKSKKHPRRHNKTRRRV